jgi:hypothetical protein
MIAAERGVLDADEVYDFADGHLWGTSGTGYQNYIGTKTIATHGQQNFWFGAREAGYAFRYAAELADLHPNSAVRSTWNSRLSAHIVDPLRGWQCFSTNPVVANRCRYPNGAYRWDDAAWAPDLAEQPWHTGILMNGVIRRHRLTGDSTAESIIEDWATHMLTSEQPGGAGSSTSLYHDGALNSDIPGVTCRSHYYWHLEGDEISIHSGEYVASACGFFTGVYQGRDVNNEIIAAYGYAHRLGVAGAKARGDDVFAATWGADDLYHGQWAWSGATNQYKTHNQGLCCNDSYLVDRLDEEDADVSALPISLSVSFNVAAVAGAAEARLTITSPDGAQSAIVCAQSPCAVMANRRQGQHRILLEYLSAIGGVIATTELTPVLVAQ